MAELFKTYMFNLAPTAAQAEKFGQFAGVVRMIYNLALEQRRDFWRQFRRVEGRNISYVSQNREVTALRREYDWIRAVHTDTLTAALIDLEKAYASFFAGRTGYPTPRRKGRNESFRFKAIYVSTRKLNSKWSEIRLPSIGWVKYRSTRELPGDMRTVTVSKTPWGWSVGVACASPLQASIAGAVGVDRGVAVAVAMSNGEMFAAPTSLVRLDAKRRRAQKILTRRQRGSKRHAKQRARVAAIASQAGRIRKDFNHRITAGITARFGVVAIEDLKISNMTASAAGTVAEPGKGVAQKRGLNRAILNQGWGQFEVFLAHKLEHRGGHLIKVNAAYTSQTCSDCGTIDKTSRESQACFVCVACGHEENADINAAKNILRASSSWLDVEGRFISPAKRQPEASGLKTGQPGMLTPDHPPNSPSAAAALTAALSGDA